MIYSEFLHHVCITHPNTSFCSLCQGELTHSWFQITGWGSPPLLPSPYQSAANWNKTSYVTMDKHCVRFKGKNNPRASLVVQWLRICLAMQRTQVLSLVWEDPMCSGTTKPMRQNHWAICNSYWRLCAWSPCFATGEATAMRSPCTLTKNSSCLWQLEQAF